MKQNYTQIAVILDRSGSMEAVRQATVEGFNEFFGTQKKQPGEADVLFVQFDDEYETRFDGKLADVPQLSVDNYIPRGWTALLDAIGRTINTLGERLEKKPEGERPNAVIVAIMTDGHENMSKEFTQPKIAEMVKHQREKYNWDFIFVGANQDAVLEAQKFNISPDAAITYNANSQSVRAVTASLGTYTAQRRMAPMRKMAFSPEDRKKARQ